MAEIEFSTHVIPASENKIGGSVFDLAAGKSLKIETSPNGEDILDIEVPEGKTWNVNISVVIVETNA